MPMNDHHDTPASASGDGTGSVAPRARPRPMRVPSARIAALLATLTLGAGIAIGAAFGPAPEASLAGSAAVERTLPALIAGLSARRAAAAEAARAQAAQAQAAQSPEAPAPRARRRRRRAARATSAPAQSTASTQPAAAETHPASSKKKSSGSSGASKLPPITSVWLVELSGSSFSEALADTSAAPYITGQLIPKATLLSGWSALEGSAFASDAALAEKRATVGAQPPALHTFVQPPCAEGAPCASGAGQLAAADEFAKAAIATITATSTYAEHGLVVLTFSTVSSATAAELPAGSSSSALASQPPGGVVLLSPFAAAGSKPAVTLKPTSPARALEALLH